jgi:hypothetical protein
MGHKSQTVAQLISGPTRQAITTKFLGATDYRGSRVVASCEARRITVPWDHAMDPQCNHAAALQLMAALGWSERNHLVMGGTKDGYVFVQVVPHE